MLLKARLQLLVMIGVLAWFTLGARLGVIQLVQAEYYQQLAVKISQEKIEIKAKRGNIYDRNGILLATDIDAVSFFAIPGKIKQPEEVAHLFSAYFKDDYNKLLANLHKSSHFVWLARRVEKKIADEIIGKKLEGVYTLPDTRRFYPHAGVAAQLLGFVGNDAHGLEGIEKQFNDELSGTPGWTMLRKDARGKDHSFPTSPPKKPVNGLDLYLTVDVNFQEIVEDELNQTLVAQEAQSGMFVLMNPQTGEILASAVAPRFDLNTAASFPLSVRRNRVVTDSYEPGSTFKFVTASVALEGKYMTPNQAIYCEKGSFDLGIHEFHDASGEYGWLTFSQVIEKSSNVGVYKIARDIGAKDIYEFALKYGFGCETGSGLTGETRGMLRQPGQWSQLSIMAIPIGQEVSVTTLQLCTAFSAIANGGELLEPQIMSKLVNENSATIKTGQRKFIRRVISPETAKVLNEILVGVVERGTGTKAQISSVQIAGKTGTAQKKVAGIDGYAPHTYVSSFLGYLPAENPQLLGIAVIDEPQHQFYGGDVAAPLFRRVAERIISNYNIIPYDIKPVELTTQNFPLAASAPDAGEYLQVKDWRGFDVAVAHAQIIKLGLFVETIGDQSSRVWRQNPLPGTSVRRGSTIQLDVNIPTDRALMPYVVGVPLREAKRRLDPFLLDVKYIGNGIVMHQSPQPGATINPGIKCRLVAEN